MKLCTIHQIWSRKNMLGIELETLTLLRLRCSPFDYFFGPYWQYESFMRYLKKAYCVFMYKTTPTHSSNRKIDSIFWTFSICFEKWINDVSRSELKFKYMNVWSNCKFSNLIFNDVVTYNQIRLFAKLLLKLLPSDTKYTVHQPKNEFLNN